MPTYTIQYITIRGVIDRETVESPTYQGLYSAIHADLDPLTQKGEVQWAEIKLERSEVSRGL